MKEKRRQRRSDNENLKRRVKKYNVAERDPTFVKNFNHPKKCSCWMCGNPRNQHIKPKDKMTIQEKRNKERTD